MLNKKSDMNNSTTANPPSTISQQPSEAVPSSSAMKNEVTYTGNGFSPKSLTVKKGDTVTWLNKDSDQLWVASGVHPDHTLYDGTSRAQHCPNTANTAFDQCKGMPTGQSYSFTFNKVGTWEYHNHLNPSESGEVVVTE